MRSLAEHASSSQVRARYRNVAIAAWCAVLGVCAIIRPLQLDEILQLVATRLPDLSSVFTSMRSNPGSVPLAYTLQWALIRIAGLSNLISRLPSIAAWPLTLFAMVRIAALVGVRRVEVVALITATIPMLFRYSIEGRSYLQAFCITAFATLLLLQFIEQPSGRPPFRRLGVYALLLACAPLVQGTAASVTLAHSVFVLTDRSMWRDRRRQVAIGAAIVISLLPPVAWSLHMREAWARAIVHDGYKFSFSTRIAAGFLKDITGGGLALTGLLIAAAIFGYAGRKQTEGSLPLSAKYLLALTAFTAVCGALASDALAGYFTSPRQAIYCLCGLVPLALAGWERFRARYQMAAVIALVLFLAVSLAKDVSVVRSKEDWKAASQLVAQAVADGYCIQPVSDLSSSLNLYSFFDPSLNAHRCAASNEQIALVHNIFTPRPDRDSAASALADRGFVSTASRTSGGTTLEFFSLQPATRSRR